MASLLPVPEQQWIDANGAPLANGTVAFYVPGTMTPKDTYQDSGETILNTNPVTLDAAGRAIIYGSGVYRAIVKDAGGNEIYDQLTADTAAGGLAWGGTSSGTPNAQIISASSFTQQDGQQISFLVGSGLTNTGAATIAPGGTGAIPILRDTSSGPTNLGGGELVAGNAASLIYDAARGAFHLVQNDNFPDPGDGKIIFFSTPELGWLECDGSAISRTTYSALFSAIGTTYGTGDGSTTFNIPDMRGYFPRGWSHGSSIDPGRAFGSTQTDAFKSHTHTASVTDPGHEHGISEVASTGAGNFGSIGSVSPRSGTITSDSATTGITVSNASTGSTETRPVNLAIMFVIKT